MNAIRCRRCSREMEKGSLAAVDGRRQAILDVCPGCNALFVEEFELGVLSEPLARLPFRIDAKESPRPDKGGCPACGAWMETVPVSGVDVDLCSECHGVWLDPGEIEALRQRGGGSPKRDPYRASVVTETLGAGMIRCASCEVIVETATTMTLPSGQVCTDCYYRREEQRLGREEIQENPVVVSMRKLLERLVVELQTPRWLRIAESHDVANPGPAMAPPCDACTARRGEPVLRGSTGCPH